LSDRVPPLAAFALACALGGASAASQAGDLLDDYMRLQTGDFTSEAQARQDSRYQVAEWHIVEIWREGEHQERWLYTEAWLAGAKGPYLQRITRVGRDGDASIIASRYTIPDATRFVGAHQDPGAFDKLRAGDLVALPGCEVTVVRAGAGRFEGGTTGDHCRANYKGAAYAVSSLVLTADGMTNWDRGFDATGNLVWGPEAGGYQLRRSPAPDVR
jgi:CpeT protein